MKKINFLVALFILTAGCANKTDNTDNLENRFVDSVVSRLTLDEKIGQMSQFTAVKIDEMENIASAGLMGSLLNEIDTVNINRLQRAAIKSHSGIPILIARDVIHGYKTVFPIPLGTAATFDTSVARISSRIAAEEASVYGIRWTFAPMLDISRDARWGRIAESFGEDPLVVSLMGEASVKGFQGQSLNNPSSMAACAKHFCGYGASESGRDYNSTYLTERQLRNVYLKPFAAAVKSGCETFMTSFNDNDGVPSTANQFLLRKVLRDEWKFTGTVVSDWSSVSEMINHGFCADEAEAAMKAINAGCDMEMVSQCYNHSIKQLIDQKKIDIKTVDECVKNIVRTKYRLGLFTNPFVKSSDQSASAESNLAYAKISAQKAAILLKNNEVLPVKNNIKSIFLCGPLADAPGDQLGTWVFDGDVSRSVTLYTALKNICSAQNIKLIYQPVLNYSRDKNTSDFSKAINAAKTCDLIIFAGGEESILSGEAHSLANLQLQGAQSDLIKTLKQTGKPLVGVIMAGRPLVLTMESDICDALLLNFHPGSMGGPAIADLLFGKAVPEGRLPVSMPRVSGQQPLYYAVNRTGRPASGKETLLNDIPINAGQTSLGCTSYFLDAGFGPLFCFGYGLSYTTFDYKNLQSEKKEYSTVDTVKVKFTLTNTGDYDGYCVPQLYTGKVSASVTRPVKELRAFKKVFVKKGESKIVDLAFTTSDLAFLNIDNKFETEAGDYNLWIADDSSLQNALSERFTIK